ncbi:hypothetical protein E2C01_045948 [Portunus trituberculatus]|uniref:Uncharacterized protein n=1 Tax=Portunus trituberculatus TaxID=210409 RepID=A0A5B7G4G8_PORTR|nr:hypothetical protein [Portunus trituberculatus]
MLKYCWSLVGLPPPSPPTQCLLENKHEFCHVTRHARPYTSYHTHSCIPAYTTTSYTNANIIPHPATLHPPSHLSTS